MKPFMNLLVCFVFIINVSSCQLKLLLYNCVLSLVFTKENHCMAVSNFCHMVNSLFSKYNQVGHILPRSQTPRGQVFCWWPPSNYQTGQPCLDRPCRWYWNMTEEGGLLLQSSDTHPLHWPIGTQIHSISDTVCSNRALQELKTWYYLIVRHLEDIAEASSTDVIRNFIRDFIWVLEWGSSYCSHIWAGNKKQNIEL